MPWNKSYIAPGCQQTRLRRKNPSARTEGGIERQNGACKRFASSARGRGGEREFFLAGCSNHPHFPRSDSFVFHIQLLPFYFRGLRGILASATRRSRSSSGTCLQRVLIQIEYHIQWFVVGFPLSACHLPWACRTILQISVGLSVLWACRIHFSASVETHPAVKTQHSLWACGLPSPRVARGTVGCRT
jgi:hypothetical protein